MNTTNDLLRHSLGQHAVVIGASMAGLLSARVLSRYFDRVTVIERDSLPDGPEFRAGVPQARHVHALLINGHRILEHYFPGLSAELTEAGAPDVRFAANTAVLTSGGWLPHHDADMVTKLASRALLEWSVRRRLTAETPGLTFVERHEVTGLKASPDGLSVTGVIMRPRERDAVETSLDADFVVDASGRSSHAPDWLQSLGYEAPATTEINSFLRYATRWYRLPEAQEIPWCMLLIAARPPQNPRGGAMFRVEGDRWIVTLAGTAGHQPPTDDEGWLSFAGELPSPVIATALQGATPLTGVFGYQNTSNRLRHYERLKRLPERFVATGDAVAAFNPVYGQGMTLAGVGARTLDQCLSAGRGSLHGLPNVFQKRLARAARNAWVMSTGEDMRYPTTVGAKPGFADLVLQKYIDRVLLLMADDPKIMMDFVQVSNLLAPPSKLMSPGTVLKVLRATLSRRPAHNDVELPEHFRIRAAAQGN